MYFMSLSLSFPLLFGNELPLFLYKIEFISLTYLSQYIHRRYFLQNLHVEEIFREKKRHKGAI